MSQRIFGSVQGVNHEAAECDGCKHILLLGPLASPDLSAAGPALPPPLGWVATYANPGAPQRLYCETCVRGAIADKFEAPLARTKAEFIGSRAPMAFAHQG